MGKGTVRWGTAFGNSWYRKCFAADPMGRWEFAIGITRNRRRPSRDIFVFVSKISLVRWGPFFHLAKHINSFQISNLQKTIDNNSISSAWRGAFWSENARSRPFYGPVKCGAFPNRCHLYSSVFHISPNWIIYATNIDRLILIVAASYGF